MRRFIVSLGLLVPLVCAAGAQAVEISPDGAQTLTRQLQDWLSALLGPGSEAPKLGLTITPDGDHYRLELPVAGLRAGTNVAGVSAIIRPLPDDRWTIEDLHLPPRASFTFFGTPSGDHAHGGSTNGTVTLARQQGSALIDPSLGSASSFKFDADGIDLTADSPTQHQQQHMDSYRASGTLGPGSAGKLELNEETTAEGWRAAARSDTGPAIAFGAERAHALATINGLDRDRVGPALAALAAVITAWPPVSGATDQLPPATRTALRTLVQGLPGIMAAARLEETIDRLQVEISGTGAATAAKLRIGMGGEAPGGMLRAWFDIGFDGLAVIGMPPSAAMLMPQHVTLRPSIAGVPTEALTRLALAATNEGADAQRLESEIAALFAQGSVTVGLEALAFTLGPAHFDGAGSVLVVSEDEVEGQARLSATGFDALTEAVRGKTELQQALPILVLARGLARTDGDRLVWDIAATRAGGITLNGIDLSSLAGAAMPGSRKP
ncbi:MAG TPA: hypothetical protein VLI93_04890 [Acetobacteraceae bacterium]|nr:hypothetical protein [Acetobacteraceae bacterium]